MAGVKGRSGGAWPNSGPKPKPVSLADVAADSALKAAAEKVAKTHSLANGSKDPAEFLEQVMGCVSIDIAARMDAAKALLPYRHAKPGAAGKKEEKQAAAEKVAGRFGASAPPKLRAVGGG